MSKKLDEIFDSDEDVSKMFDGKSGTMSSDEELTLQIIHKFNICSETLEAMPSLEERLEPLLFSKVKEK